MAIALSIIGVVLYAALALRLWRVKLDTSYRWLFYYCIFAACRIALTRLFFKSANTDFYFYWWAATEVLAWVLFVLMILELHGLIFQHYPGLASFGRKLFQVGLGVSIPVSLLTLLPEIGPAQTEFPIYVAVIVVQRGVLTSLIIFLFVLLASLIWLRVTLNRNSIVHAIVFFSYFLARAGVAFVFQSLGIQVRGPLTLALLAIADLCVAAWIFGLTQKGESTELQIGHRWNPEEGQRLVDQLNAINSSLSRSPRK